MGRAPCCEKMGLKKGPWTHEEDELLVAYIQQHGHGNWRALPKLAGLLRCGKSCRLRWTNYLRPDIKRGNFSREEEDTIMKLHELLGNRWSAIAAKLPGRTDNEIKNVWHTHLKKRLKQSQSQDTAPHVIKSEEAHTEKESNPNYYATMSPPQATSSEFSSGMESATSIDDRKIKEEYTNSWETLPRSDEHLWSNVMPRMEHFGSMEELSAISADPEVQFPVSSVGTKAEKIDEGIDFWSDVDLFVNTDELSELPEF